MSAMMEQDKKALRAPAHAAGAGDGRSLPAERQPWKAPECRSLALCDLTRAAPNSTEDGGSLVS